MSGCAPEEAMMTELVPYSTPEVLSPTMGLEDAIEAFLSEHDVAASSRATYRRMLRRFQAWLKDTGRLGRLGELRRADIIAYKAELSQHHKPTSVSGYLTAVRRFFSYLETVKVYPNIAAGIKGPKKPRGFRKDTLTPSQVRAALASIGTDSEEGLRNFAILNLMARTGLRDIEVARADIGDLRQQGGETVLYIQGKGRASKDEVVLLVDEALEPLLAYLAARGCHDEEAPLFASCSRRNRGGRLTTRSISRVVKEAFRGIGLDSPRLTAHSLRHTAISLAIKGGASLHQAQAMARHADPKTTMIYFHNEQRIQQAAERCIHY